MKAVSKRWTHIPKLVENDDACLPLLSTLDIGWLVLFNYECGLCNYSVKREREYNIHERRAKVLEREILSTIIMWQGKYYDSNYNRDHSDYSSIYFYYNVPIIIRGYFTVAIRVTPYHRMHCLVSLSNKVCKQ